MSEGRRYVEYGVGDASRRIKAGLVSPVVGRLGIGLGPLPGTVLEDILSRSV